MDQLSIFGISIDALTRAQAFQCIDDVLHSRRPTWIVTVNPEILLHAYRNAPYAALLRQATIRIPDGVGLRLVSNVHEVVPGVDIADYALQRAEQGKLRLICIVRAHGLSSLDAVLDAVHRRAPHAECRGVALALDQIQQVGIVKTISDFRPDIVLVGLGFPRQEEWLARHLSSIPSAAIGIGVGGTFDYWTGLAHRAPMFLRHIGLEWLWRLIHNPRRFGRIFNAVVVFPILATIDHFWPKKRSER